MRIRLLFGILLLLSSCKEPLVLPLIDENSDILEIDTVPPKIKWISPHFDEVVNEVVIVKCQVMDKSGISKVELWVDSLQSGMDSTAGADSIYLIPWKIMNFHNGEMPLLFINAVDNEGNDTVSQIIRVIIDNNQEYPEPVVLYPLDSLFIDSVFSGYTLRWWYSGDQYFKKYMLHQSSDPLMTNSIEIFSTEEKRVIQYEDNTIDHDGLFYYQVIVEDIFGKQTAGNVISTSMNDMPPLWDIQSVQYAANFLSISWNNLPFERYKFHQILFSDNRKGDYQILETLTDSLIYQYETVNFVPNSENWFSIQVGDSLGQISMSTPYFHPPPQVPIIDSILYRGNSFRLQWGIEPDLDFANYRILFSEDEDAFTLSDVIQINNQAEDTLHHSVNESEYYLYQVITTDVWGLEAKGPVVTVSSFNKFSTTVGGSATDNLYSIIATDEGGYIAVGESSDEGSFLVQINGLGEVGESINYNDSNSGFRCITNAPNGGYLLTGFTRTAEDMDNLLVYKIDESGNSEWTIFSGYDFNDRGNAIVSLSDGGIGVTGYLHTSPGNQDLFVIKIDEDGNEIWSKTFGGDKSDEGHDILPIDGGGMVVLGETHSQGDDDGDIWLLKFDADGNSLDTLLISLEGKQVGYSFEKTSNGDYIIGGKTVSSNSGVTDAYIIKVNDAGEIIWGLAYGGIFNDAGYSIISSDGGWVLGGQTYSYDVGGGDLLLLKVNDFGELEWVETFGGDYRDIGKDIKLALDGGLIICGSTFSQNNTNGWLIKTDSRGNYKSMAGYP